MSAPPVPHDVDLRGMPFMPLHVGRLMDSDLFALSNGDEFKAAVALWCKSWHQQPAASLPDDDRILALWSGQLQRWRKVREMALRNWVKCDDGRLYHPLIAEAALEAWKHRQAQRAKAEKRWGRDPELPGIPAGIPAGDPDAPPAGLAPGDPAASAAAMQGTGTVKGQGQKNNTGRAGGGSLNGHSHHAAKGTRMTEDWRLPDAWRDWACKVYRIEPQRAVRISLAFRDWYLQVAGDRGVRRSWEAAWRSWLRKEFNDA